MFGELRWDPEFTGVSGYHGLFVLFGLLNFGFTLAQAAILKKEYDGSCFTLNNFLT
jgi:hypothetical protein